MLRSPIGTSNLRRRALLVVLLAMGSSFVVVDAGASATTLHPSVGILPPADPSSNIAIPSAISSYSCTTTAAGQSCTGTCVSAAVPALNKSAECQSLAVNAINRGRAREHVRALRLPRNWTALSVPEQLFVLADLERVDRGLPPYVGLVPALNSVAQTAADAATDPSYPTAGLRGEGGNWSVSAPSPLIADLEWMYADGAGGANVGCSQAGASGCWGHRNNILGIYTGLTCANCMMGAGYDPAFKNDGPAYSELFVAPGPTVKLTPNFTWAKNVLPYLS